MAANTTPIFPLTIQTYAVAVVPADTTTEKTLVTAGAYGTRIDVISVTSTDTSAQTFKVLVNDGATSYQIGEVVVPITSGTDGVTLAVKALNTSFFPWLDSSGSIFLEAGWKLNVACKSTVTVAKQVTWVAFAGDY
jgi:hypothetical protein